jgi:hypothetical protein
MGNSRIKDGARLVGDKLTKGGINTLRDEGYSKADIYGIADRIGNVGDKVQGKISGWGGSGGGSSGGEEDRKPWITHSVALPGTSGQRIWTNEDGGIAARNSDIDGVMADVQYGGLQAFRNRMATTQSAEKLNRYLEKTGYSLQGGKGQAVVGYRPVTLEGTNYGANPYLSSYGGGIDGDWPGSREYVPIYGAAPQKAKKPKQPDAPEVGRDSGGGGGEPPPASFGGSEEANRLIREGTFDVPARPTYGEEFLQDYMADRDSSNGGGDTSGPDPNAPVMQVNGSYGSLRDGYPRAGDWSPPRNDGSENWNITPGGTPEDNAELTRTFAASQAFRDRLFGMVGV